MLSKYVNQTPSLCHSMKINLAPRLLCTVKHSLKNKIKRFTPINNYGLFYTGLPK
jgi:hypothetical protein